MSVVFEEVRKQWSVIVAEVLNIGFTQKPTQKPQISDKDVMSPCLLNDCHIYMYVWV